MEKWFLIFIGVADTHHAGPYDDEAEARECVEEERQAGDKYCVVVGPVPTDDLPASGLITLT